MRRIQAPVAAKVAAYRTVKDKPVAVRSAARIAVNEKPVHVRRLWRRECNNAPPPPGSSSLSTSPLGELTPDDDDENRHTVAIKDALQLFLGVAPDGQKGIGEICRSGRIPVPLRLEWHEDDVGG